jgi:HlyD family secretion protein
MPSDKPLSRASRVWRKWVLVIGLIAVAVLAVSAIPNSVSSQDSGPRLTHTIKRGDLIVTVTEQGVLESAENTEIKCTVRTASVPITWVIESGSEVKPGDVLVRLSTLDYEDRLTEVSKWVYSAHAGLALSTANTRRAKLAVSEYLEGRYLTQLMTLKKDIAIAESNLLTAKNMLTHEESMAQRGYVADLDLERAAFAVTQAQMNVSVKQKEIRVLTDFTKAMEMETLKGDLEASLASHEANKAQVQNADVQLRLCQGDLENCVVKAEKSGIVIYPTGQPWERVPEIEEGANIYMGQTMLLMPDLSQMQVKLGIRESLIDRMKIGLKARVKLPNRTLDGEVDSVASVAKPAAWWNGNAVRYDTVVTLGSVPGLMPGMSAQVEVIVAEHQDVLIMPVAAIVESVQGTFCWVKTTDGTEKRSLRLGDTNDRFTVVEGGLLEGDKVILNPLAIAEAQALAQQAEETTELQDPNQLKTEETSESKSDAKATSSGPQILKPSKGSSKKEFSPNTMNSGSKTK